MTASPTYFSTLPPCSSRVARATSKKGASRWRSSSGSRSVASSVEPTRSAKTIVAELPLGALHRVEGRAAGGAEAGVVGHQRAAACTHLAHGRTIAPPRWPGSGRLDGRRAVACRACNDGRRRVGGARVDRHDADHGARQVAVVGGRRRGLQRVPDPGRRHLAAARLRQRRVREAPPVSRLHGARRRASSPTCTRTTSSTWCRTPTPSPTRLASSPSRSADIRARTAPPAPADRSKRRRASASAAWSAPGATRT